ncbi:phage major capsid family protein [Novacetimonas hansenii]|uniref:Phage capsid-like C-terminal domain-containing protein n=1 Tax=Novacetimonas hansenii TaxID=436 RepID=A0ABQ0SH70_NOVHA|nr:phage major capsid protein [Novacetimonas hansenii]GAN84044.1 hypothetical protein Gaha_0122_044 [Novacetimonas hansenii JCM 7643]GBQ55861.1 hypothetical protein AA0243_1032 [Novacetimonas hansenii NRIC 0243]GEC64624.1 hypothetical protein GHA01_24730 [Novacetimonas hansenii]
MAISIKELKKQVSLLKSDLKDISDDIIDGDMKDEDTSDLNEKYEELKNKISKLEAGIKRKEEEEEKEDDQEEDHDDVSEKSYSAPAIVKYTGNKCDTDNELRKAARHVISRAWAANPMLGEKGAAKRFQQEFGKEAFDREIVKSGPGMVGSFNFQAPNYRPDMLIPLLNKNIVTTEFVRNVDLKDNNLIAPRVISPSSGAFNLENGLISTSNIGSDVVTVEGQFYGSILYYTKQALNFSGGILEDLIVEEMQSRHKLTVEQILFNSTGLNNAPMGMKGYTSGTQNIVSSDFSTVSDSSAASAQAAIQQFADLIATTDAKMRNAGDYSERYLIVPELVLGKIKSRVTQLGNFVFANILDGDLFGVKVLSSSNISTNEDSLVTGATATGKVAPCYLVSKDKLWQGNGNFYAFEQFNAGTVDSTNLVQQVGQAYRLVDTMATALTNDISLFRLEINGFVDAVDNSNTAYEQPASGDVSTATGIGKAKTSGTGSSTSTTTGS